MAIYQSVAAAMGASGYTGQRLSGSAMYWSKPKPSTTTAPGSASTLNQNVDVAQSIESAIAANAAAMRPAAEEGRDLSKDMAQDLNPEMAREFEKALLDASPQARAIQAQMAENTGSMLRGEIPDDVADLIRQYSAEQQMQGTHAGTARNLGRTSLDLSTQGFQQGLQLQEMSSRYLTAPTVDIAGQAASMRDQIYGRTTLDPGQAGSLSLQSEQLSAQESAMRADLDWQRELSSMNKARESFIDQQQADLLRRSVDAQAATQGAMTSGFRSVAGLTGAGAFGSGYQFKSPSYQDVVPRTNFGYRSGAYS